MKYYYTIYREFPDRNHIDGIRLAHKTIENINDYLSSSIANSILEIENINKEPFLLDNGVDVRFYKKISVKEISRYEYDEILKINNNIYESMSYKSKNLLIKFGFDPKNIHGAFVII